MARQAKNPGQPEAKPALDKQWQVWSRHGVVAVLLCICVAGITGGILSLFDGPRSVISAPAVVSTAPSADTTVPLAQAPTSVASPAPIGAMSEVAGRCVRASQNYQAPDPAAADPATALAAAKTAYLDQLGGCFADGTDTTPLWDGKSSQTATEPFVVTLTVDTHTATFNVRLRVTGPAWKYFLVTVSCDASHCWLASLPTPTNPPTPS